MVWPQPQERRGHQVLCTELMERLLDAPSVVALLTAASTFRLGRRSCICLALVVLLPAQMFLVFTSEQSSQSILVLDACDG